MWGTPIYLRTLGSGHPPSGIVGVAVHAVVVLRRAGIVAGEGGKESLRAVLLPAVGKTVVNVRVDCSTAILIGPHEAIERIVDIGPDQPEFLYQVQ